MRKGSTSSLYRQQLFKREYFEVKGSKNIQGISGT